METLYEEMAEGQEEETSNFQEDGSLPKDSKGNEIIYGREIDMPITPMKDVDVYTGQVAIRGRVVGIEIKRLQMKSNMLFHIADNTGAVTVKFFLSKGPKAVSGAIKKNMHFTVMGKTEFDPLHMNCQSVHGV